MVVQPDGFAASIGIQIPSITQYQRSDKQEMSIRGKLDESDGIETSGGTFELPTLTITKN